MEVENLTVSPPTLGRPTLRQAHHLRALNLSVGSKDYALCECTAAARAGKAVKAQVRHGKLLQVIMAHAAADRRSRTQWNHIIPKASTIGTFTMPACVPSIRARVGAPLPSAKA